MGKVVAVIGGRDTRVKQSQTQNIRVVHHDAWSKSKTAMRSLESIVKKADVVLLMTDACSHGSMYRARKLSKRYQKPMQYLKRTGSKSLLEHAQEMLRKS